MDFNENWIIYKVLKFKNMTNIWNCVKIGCLLVQTFESTLLLKAVIQHFKGSNLKCDLLFWISNLRSLIVKNFKHGHRVQTNWKQIQKRIMLNYSFTKSDFWFIIGWLLCSHSQTQKSEKTKKTQEIFKFDVRKIK